MNGRRRAPSHPVGDACRSGERCSWFYSAVLGIPRVAEPAHLEPRSGCWFEDDTVRIHLGVEDDFRPARKAHPGFLVEDPSLIRERLEAAGVAIVEPLPGYDRVYVDDPFGNHLEFLAED